jgi:hypothetical protein
VSPEAAEDQVGQATAGLAAVYPDETEYLRELTRGYARTSS